MLVVCSPKEDAKASVETIDTIEDYDDTTFSFRSQNSTPLYPVTTF